MTDKELLLAIYNDTQELKQRVSNMEDKMQNMESEIQNARKDINSVKRRVMKSTAELKAMDKIVLDEVERVHNILDRHKADKSVHTL